MDFLTNVISSGVRAVINTVAPPSIHFEIVLNQEVYAFGDVLQGKVKLMATTSDVSYTEIESILLSQGLCHWKEKEQDAEGDEVTVTRSGKKQYLHMTSLLTSNKGILVKNQPMELSFQFPIPEYKKSLPSSFSIDAQNGVFYSVTIEVSLDSSVPVLFSPKSTKYFRLVHCVPFNPFRSTAPPVALDQNIGLFHRGILPACMLYGCILPFWICTPSLSTPTIQPECGCGYMCCVSFNCCSPYATLQGHTTLNRESFGAEEEMELSWSLSSASYPAFQQYIHSVQISIVRYYQRYGSGILESSAIYHSNSSDASSSKKEELLPQIVLFTQNLANNAVDSQRYLNHTMKLIVPMDSVSTFQGKTRDDPFTWHHVVRLSLLIDTSSCVYGGCCMRQTLQPYHVDIPFTYVLRPGMTPQQTPQHIPLTLTDKIVTGVVEVAKELTIAMLEG